MPISKSDVASPDSVEESQPNIQVCIIAGGLTHEREVSLRSAQRVSNVLRALNYSVKILDVDSQLIGRLQSMQPDVVWPLVHGSVGEDGSLQDLLELLGLPFVGSSADGCRIASNKAVAKSVVAKNGLPTPTGVAFPQELFQQLGATALLDTVVDSLSFPIIVKPVNGGSALGVTKTHNTEQLRGAMVDAFAYGEQILLERVVQGREIAVSIIDIDGQARTLPPVEVTTDDDSYDYDARYMAGRTEFFVPARLTKAEEAIVREQALRCHQVLELRHLSRIDLILGEDGVAWCIDANVVPGMTDMSLFPVSAEADSSFSAVLDQIVQSVVNSKNP